MREGAKYPPLIGYRRDNIEYANKLRKWINKGEELLLNPPEGFNFDMLFALNTAETVSDLMRDADARKEYLHEVLSVMLNRCSKIIATKFGEHGSSGYQQEQAAIASGELMQHCGLPLTYSTDNSKYCEVARIFYEEMTGKAGDTDLYRACQRMARKTIRTEK
jgi:hypothetical protein